ncbi:MAG: DUF2341 domain-containing protein [Candidatus Thorarchaeota archaeon]|jgi:hypothetical protein
MTSTTDTPVVQINEDRIHIESSASSWLPGWKYRKSHNLTGADGAGTNYQIQFTVHYSNGTDTGMDVYCGENCSQDFSDIRFTGSDEYTVFDYWNETTVSSDYAIFWVKIGENLNQSATIFMYYGNEYAVSESNGEATCEFFEDFSEPFNSTKWNHTSRLPTFEDGLGQFSIDPGYTWDPLAIATPYELPDRGYRLRTSMRFNTVNDFNARSSYFGFGYSNIGTYGINGAVCIDATYEDTNLELRTIGDEDFHNYGPLGDVHIDYRNYELLVEPFGAVSLTNGISTVSGTLDYAISLRPSIGIVVNGAYNGNHILTRYEEFWITKWQSVEPQHAQWGNVTESPYLSDVTSPVVDFSLEDFPLEAGDHGWAVWWNVTEENPYQYQIFVDDVLIEQSIWVDYTIVFSLETIVESLGAHEITLKAIDLNSNVVTDDVVVTVIDTTAPVISHPADIEMAYGDGTVRIIWTITELFPANYTVTRGSDTIMSGDLTSGSIVVDLDYLQPNWYSFTITVLDTSGNRDTDNVIVRVTEQTTTTDPTAGTEPPGPILPSFDFATIVLFGIGTIILLGGCLMLRGSGMDDMSSGYQYY